MSDTLEPQWGRRESDRDGTALSTAKVDQADKAIRVALVALLVLFAMLAAGALWIGWRTGQRMEHLINETQLSAQRNTELLAVECDLETGKPKPLPSEEPFRNTDEFLVAFCGRQVKQANTINDYITDINNAVKEQIAAHDVNTNNRHERIEALVQRRPVPTVVRKPIPGSTTTTRKAPAPITGTITTTTTTARPVPPAPAPTTTTCIPNKRERCKEKP